jgi:hypothetical protein
MLDLTLLEKSPNFDASRFGIPRVENRKRSFSVGNVGFSALARTVVLDCNNYCLIVKDTS